LPSGPPLSPSPPRATSYGSSHLQGCSSAPCRCLGPQSLSQPTATGFQPSFTLATVSPASSSSHSWCVDLAALHLAPFLHPRLSLHKHSNLLHVSHLCALSPVVPNHTPPSLFVSPFLRLRWTRTFRCPFPLQEYDVPGRAQLSAGPLPLGDAQLTWFGYTEQGGLAMSDAKGILSVR